MLFAGLSLAISLFLLFTAWEDGKLLRNAQELWVNVKPSIDELASRRTAAPDIQWERIGDRLDGVRARVSAGDGRARDYLDNLMADLELLREYSGEHSREWVGQTLEQLARARETIGDNAPETLRRLGEAGEQLRAHIGGGAAPAAGGTP